MSEFDFAVGDPSASNSEMWEMSVVGGGAELLHPSTQFGVVERHPYALKAGQSYDVEVRHRATSPSHLDTYGGADYDYYAGIETVDGSLPHWFDDPDELMGGHATNLYTTPNTTQGKVARLHVPLLDADVDSDSDNDNPEDAPDHTDDEERIEETAEGAKLVTANTGDLDGNGVPDFADGYGLYGDPAVIGAPLVPMVVRLSENLAESGADLDEILLTFAYDGASDPAEVEVDTTGELPVYTPAPGFLRLWKEPEGSGNRALSDYIASGTPVTAEALGLSPGGEVTVWIEAVRGLSSTLPIILTAQVQGEAFEGELTDTTTTRPVEPEIRFLTRDESNGGTKGDLFGSDPAAGDGNPNGENGTPDFKGGLRFFPDADTFQNRAESRNVVRVRATFPGKPAGTPVYFRSFDVDDPSEDNVIDPNGGNGGDNRGRLNTEDITKPRASGDPDGGGHPGRLRTVAGQIRPQGAVAQVDTVIKDGVSVAEIDFLTTFAAGDNFRVVASLDRNEVEGLDQPDSVPTSGDTVPGFGGVATEQLSVWRRFHVERDRMAPTAAVDTVPARTRQKGQPANGQLTLTLHSNLPDADRYKGGLLRVDGKNYPIVSNTSGPNSTVTIAASDNVPAIVESAVPGNATELFLYEDDFAAEGDQEPIARVNTGNDDHLYDMMQASVLLSANKFSQAYIQPHLDTFDGVEVGGKPVLSDDVTADPHVANTNVNLRELLDPFRATKSLEGDMFWVAYVSTAFEPEPGRDNDPDSEAALDAAAEGIEGNVSLIYLETGRDIAAEAGMNPAEYYARVTVHEVGHQFALAFGEADKHREPGQNIMSGGGITSVPADQFSFDPRDVDFLRKRVFSPGLDQPV